MTTSRKYSRLVADMYLPAIASAMNLHIRTIQNISGYYGILNTLPLNDKDEKSRKIITLIIQDDIYQPVVAISTEGNGTSTEENAISTEANDRNGKEDSSKKALVFLSPQCTKKKSTSEVILISDSEEEFTPVVIEPRDVEEISPPISPLPTYFDDGLLQQEEEPLEDIKWEDAVRRTSLGGRKTSIDMKLFKGMIPDVVAQIPHDINGLKYYAIDIPEDQTFFSRYRDGRYFDMNSSTRKGFRGVRRIGGCRGNFICTNKDCAYLIENGKENQHQFTTIGKNKFCYVCNGIVYRRPCGAVKMIEYHVTMRLLEVYHQGEHTCQVKPETTIHDKAIEESIKRYGVRVTPKEIAQMRMTEELKKQFDSGEHDMNKIVDIGSQFTDRKRISNIKARIQNEMKSEKHSMAAVGELKTCTDTSDNYLIYKVYDQNMAGCGKSFVFKSSRKMANLCLNMDQDRPHKGPLASEPCYFDGMHRRCAGWKTLTLWVYHPTSRKLMRLASMEVHGENTETTSLFWQTLNSMLQEVSGDEQIMFNPYMFITDEAGANANGITQVFGQEGYKKSRTCQFHFKQGLHRMLTKFPANLSDVKTEFEQLMCTLCTISTLSEYEEVKSRLLEICALVPAVENGVQWWLARRYNLFPVFRGYCISSVNMAEIGHSTLKRKKPLALVDACWEDVCTIILQEQEHTKFLAGRGFSLGRGPSQGEFAKKENKGQMKRAREYSQAFKEKVFNITEQDGGGFIPSKRARHRHPDQQVFPVQGNVENESPGPGARPTALGRALGLNENPPLLTFLHGFKISICYGCKSKFGAKLRESPNDLIIKMQVKRDRLVNGKWIPGWKKTWAYFHLAVSCLKLEKSVLEIEDIYVPNETRDTMTAGHVAKLQNMGWWDKVKKR